MRNPILALLISASALAGCASSDDPHMAEALQRDSDIGKCNESMNRVPNGLSTLGPFRKCMSEKGWNVRVDTDFQQWVRQTDDALGVQNPGGECKFTYSEQVRDILVVPLASRHPVRMAAIAETAGAGRYLTLNFSADEYKLDTPDMRSERGWVILTFYPKEDYASWPDLIVSIDPCTSKVIEAELHFDT